MANKKYITIPLEGWLARSKLMGYELFSEKPELRNEDGSLQWRILEGFTTENRGLYVHLGSSHISMDSSVHLGNEKVRRVKLELTISTRKRKKVDEVETAQPEGSTMLSEEKATIGKMTRTRR